MEQLKNDIMKGQSERNQTLHDAFGGNMEKAMSVGTGMIGGMHVSSPTMPDQLEDIDKKAKKTKPLGYAGANVISMSDYDTTKKW